MNGGIERDMPEIDEIVYLERQIARIHRELTMLTRYELQVKTRRKLSIAIKNVLDLHETFRNEI